MADRLGGEMTDQEQRQISFPPHDEGCPAGSGVSPVQLTIFMCLTIQTFMLRVVSGPPANVGHFPNLKTLLKSLG